MSKLRRQASIQTQFTRHVAYCKKIPQGTTTYELSERHKSIVELYQEFRELQEEIEEECGTELV